MLEYADMASPPNGAGRDFLEWLSEMGRQGWELKHVERYDEGGWYAVVQREAHASQDLGDAA